jgi:hypothetical protein
VKLGKPGPGKPWLIEIIAKARKLADPRLTRMLGDCYPGTVQWRAGDGTHDLFLGDDRLAAFAPLRGGGLRPEDVPGGDDLQERRSHVGGVDHGRRATAGRAPRGT